MKREKIIALMLSVTMLAGIISGCSKASNINADKFVKACEKLSLEEYDDYLEKSPDLSDAEDGYYLVADDEDDIEKLTGSSFDEILKFMDLDDDIEPDDIKSIAGAVKCSGLDDFKDFESLEDLEIDGAIALQLTLKNDKLAGEIIDGFDDILGLCDIRSKHLTNKEYYCSDKEGYIRLHVDLEKFAKVLSDDDDAVEEFESYSGIDLEDYIGGLKGDIAVSIEVSGGNVFILIGGSVNTKATAYNDFAKAFGLSYDPMNLPANDKFYKDLADLFPSLIKYLVKAAEICGTQPEGSGHKVGISLPTKDLSRWKNDGDTMKFKFEAKGYNVDLQFAKNDVATQISQIENMINSGCRVLIIAPIESSSLGVVLEEAHERNIPVIAYDRMIYDTEYVDYYVTFDNYMTGTLQGQYIAEKLDLENTNGPFYIEITAGDPSDVAAAFFFNGAMDVLRQYIDSGKLVVKSGQTSFDAAATPEWRTDTAQARAENIITMFYSDGTQIDAWLCPNDSTALGVTNALAANYVGKYPVITGQDCDIANVKNIINGKQSMSVFKDTRNLAERAVIMAEQIFKRQVVEVNDTKTYNNGKKVVPAFLCSPIFVNADNYKTVLIDSGYYTADQLS